jgi:hypothetical protein
MAISESDNDDRLHEWIEDHPNRRKKRGPPKNITAFRRKKAGFHSDIEYRMRQYQEKEWQE